MTWLGPDEAADPGGRRGRWVHLCLGYGLLAISTVAVLLTGDRPSGAWHADSRPGTLALVLLAAAWLPLLVVLFPVRARRPGLVILYYAVIVVLGASLVARSSWFTVYAAIGYPLAFALMPAQLIMPAVGVTAVTGVLAQAEDSASGTFDGAALYTVVLGVAVPLLFAGWYVAALGDRRGRLVTELTETTRRLRAAMEENAGLQARLLAQARAAGVLEERRRMAREIHDTIAQGLVALVTQLRAADRAREHPEQRQRHMDQVRALARQSLDDARRSVRALRPEPLEHSALPDALTEMAGRWARASSSPMPVVEVTGTPRPMVTGIEVALFRVAQEALANVAKHAGAVRVGVTLSYLDDVVLLDVRDDGVGFDPERVGRAGDRFGLSTMRERLRGVGGVLAIESAPGQGTAVAASVPALPAGEIENGET